jgi:hypothetical protein
MNICFVRRRSLVVAGLAAATLTAACEDKRVKELNAGISRDSAVNVISQGVKPGATPDSFPNVYWRERFLAGGKNYEVLYFTPNNDKWPAPTGGKAPPIDSIPFKRLTPIVFVNNTLVGRGWKFWDSAATANKLQTHKHD